MYNTGVPEKIISDISGHRSLKALRAYERTSTAQQKSAGQSIHCGKAFDDVGKENYPISSNTACTMKPVLATTSAALLTVI